jgi:hypothetical protein
MDVCSLRLLTGWTVRLFKRGAAVQSPIVILSPTDAATDPMECERLVPLPYVESVYDGLADTLINGTAASGVAFVCSGLYLAHDLLARCVMAGATELEAVHE